VPQQLAQHVKRGLAKAIHQHTKSLLHGHFTARPRITQYKIQCTNLAPISMFCPYKAILDNTFASTPLALHHDQLSKNKN
jgi:hypothetical protein